MKKLTLFVLFAVVELTCSAQHLDIGSRAYNHPYAMSLYLSYEGETVAYLMYTNTGDVRTELAERLEELYGKFVPQPHQTGRLFQISVSGTAHVSGSNNGMAVIWNGEKPPYFALENGRLPANRASLYGTLSLPSYVRYERSGTVAVRFEIVENGTRQVTDSRNGVSDPTCNLFDLTDGMLYFPNNYIEGKQGSVTLFFDQAKTQYEKYDLATGDLIESTRPAEMPVISIERDGGGLVLVISGGEGRSVEVESSSDLTVWQPLTSLYVKASPTRYPVNLDTSAPYRFYRAKLAQTQPAR